MRTDELLVAYEQLFIADSTGSPFTKTWTDGRFLEKIPKLISYRPGAMIRIDACIHLCIASIGKHSSYAIIKKAVVLFQGQLCPHLVLVPHVVVWVAVDRLHVPWHRSPSFRLA